MGSCYAKLKRSIRFTVFSGLYRLPPGRSTDEYFVPRALGIGRADSFHSVAEH